MMMMMMMMMMMISYSKRTHTSMIRFESKNGHYRYK